MRGRGEEDEEPSLSCLLQTATKHTDQAFTLKGLAD